MWNEVFSIYEGMNDPWLVGGNFNVVLNGDGKLEGLLVMQILMILELALNLVTCIIYILSEVLSHGGMGEQEMIIFLKELIKY